MHLTVLPRFHRRHRCLGVEQQLSNSPQKNLEVTPGLDFNRI
jgi:hypothetical protein